MEEEETQRELKLLNDKCKKLEDEIFELKKERNTYIYECKHFENDGSFINTNF
jgi:phage FluMu protein Com